MSFKALAAAFCASALLAPAALAADGAAAQFGARQRVQQVSLSPDGKKVAILAATSGRGTALLIGDVDAGGEPRPILAGNGDPERITDCHWTTSTRLVCGVYFIEKGPDAIAFTRQVALNADGSKVVELSAKESVQSGAAYGGQIIDFTAEGAEGSVLMTRSYMEGMSTGTMLAGSRAGVGVERVDTTTLKRSPVEAPNGSLATFISDGRGKIRVMAIQPKANSGYDRGQIEYRYRKAGSRDWLPLSTYIFETRKGFQPVAVDPDLDVAYGFDSSDGRQALYRVSLDGSQKRELVGSRPDVDVDDLLQVGRQQRVVGYSYATDRRQAVFFDPALEKLGAGLAKALKGAAIDFVDASADEQRLILLAGSDVDPGRFYLYDKGTRKLSPIMAVRPELDGTALANVSPITYEAADGTKIPAYLTLPLGSSGKGLPTIVMPHGGPESRDEWGFDWLAQYFANRGFAVLQPNFRGSAGYGDAWFKENGYRSWRTSIGDVDDAGRWLVKQGIAAPDRLAIVGWSYGGYAALQSGVLDPGLYKAIVAIAPVTDLETHRNERRDFADFRVMDQRIGTGPHVREGSPAQNASKFVAPVLMFHGDLDQNVGVGESRLMLSRLKDAGKRADLVVFHDLDHQLDDDKARTEMLGRIDAFLRAELKLP